MKLLPQVEELEGKYAGRIKLTKVEAPQNRRLCLNLKVMGLPSLFFFKDGKETDRLSGAIDIAAVEVKIRELL